MKTSSLFLTFFIGVILTPLSVFAIDIKGDWAIVTNWGGELFPQAWKVTQQASADGAFSGLSTYNVGGAPFGTVSGSITGQSFTLINPYSSGGYVANFVGTTNGTTMTGSWTSSWGQSGSFTGARVNQALGIEGIVKNPNGDGVAGVDLKLTGETTDGDQVSKVTTSGTDGSYSFEVKKGTYEVVATGEGDYFDKGEKKKENGGVLSAEAKAGGDCGGTADKNKCSLTVNDSSRKANFSYTLCAADERMPNGKPLTHCPIILVPGFLGSIIACNGSEIWPGLPLPGWKQMLLESDGVTNVNTSSCNSAAAPLEGEAGVVATVAGTAIYSGALDFLKDQAPDRWRAAPYDWRKSPVFGAGVLAGVVDELLEATKSKHVVLYGHSMGGLVIREYLNNQSNVNKVTRVVTAGTPYWGAPKSHFALLGGYTDTPGGSNLDYLTFAADLQLLARNLQGLFYLYPSANLGAWLSVSPTFGKPLTLQGPSGEIEWVSALGASPILLPNARSWHTSNDGFPSTDIDYRVVVGSGTATTQEVKIRMIPGIEGTDTFGDIVIGNGDSTVPLRSATQGGSDSGAPLGKNVPIHYACGVSHVDLPGDSLVLAGIRHFLLAGEDITGLKTKCPYSGTALLMYNLDLGGGNEINVNPEGFQPRSLNKAAASAPMSLDEAVKQGIVQFIPIGKTTIILTDDAKPVTITLNGKPVAFQLRKFSSDGDGETQSFKPMKGPIVIDVSGQALSTTGSKLTGIKGGSKAPKTTATTTKSGANVSIKLKAKGSDGVSGIFYQIGKGSPQNYKKKFKVKIGKKPVKVSFYSVNLFGVAEKTKKVTVGN